jgi:hypothetical protein
MARILYAVGSWGLGHATRSLPLIRGLVDAGQAVTILGSGGALRLLRAELGDRCDLLDFPGMRVPLGSSPFRFYFKYTVTLPIIWWETWRQHVELEAILAARGFDIIVSDNRYAAWSDRVPSYLLAHGLRFIAPGRSHLLEVGLEWFNALAFQHYRRILVPDFASDDLSGDLSHGTMFYPSDQVRYIGLLSSVAARPVASDLDAFISISGPEPQRTILERTVLRQLPRVPARGLVALGRPGVHSRQRLGQWEVAGYLDRAEQEAALNRCRLAVVRAGYSTIMELAELGRTAVLIPTPGQTEQEYISQRLARLGHAHFATQDGLDVSLALSSGAPAVPYVPPHLTDRSVRLFLDAVL